MALLEIISILLFFLIILRVALAFKTDLTCREKEVRGSCSSRRRVYMWLGLWIAIVNAFFVWQAFRGSSTGLVESLEGLWYNTIDANNYAEIARYWYFPVEGSSLIYKIVFFPLYPIIMRIVQFFTRYYVIAGLVVSSGCAFLGGVFLYKLAERERGDSFAGRSLRYLFIFPAAFFFMTPMTEGLFLLTNTAFFYFLTNKRYATAAVLGFLAALTRSQGVLLVIPFGAELLTEAFLKKDVGFLIKKIWYAAAPVLGIGVYLLINLHIYDDPFRFMTYQQEHWHNSMSWFWDTPAYLVKNMGAWINADNMCIVLGLSVPNLAAFFGGLLLLLIGAGRLRPSITLYGLAYFVMSFGISWLLSGPRYLSACFVPAMALAAATEKRQKTDAALTFFYLLLFVIYLCLFINRCGVV